MNMHQIIEYLKENLRIETSTSSNYTGGMDGSGSLYQTEITIKLVLDGEEISSVTI